MQLGDGLIVKSKVFSLYSRLGLTLVVAFDDLCFCYHKILSIRKLPVHHQ